MKATVKRVYMVRHPETDWNLERRYQGRTGRPLSDNGLAAMETLVERLSHKAPQEVISSPTKHAFTLAEELVRRAGLESGVRTDEGWCEVDHGNWEGLRHDEVIHRFGQEAIKRFEDPLCYSAHGGETLDDVDRRVDRSWRNIVAAAGESTVVISHATPISLVLCRSVGVSPLEHRVFRIDHGSVTAIEVTGASTVIDFTNQRSNS